MCVNAASAGACDERLDVAVGSWEVLTIDVYQRMLTKLGTVPARVKMFMGGLCKGAATEVWVDNVMFMVNGAAPATPCLPIQVTSAATIRRSCYDHYTAGARTDGVYQVQLT